MSTYDTLRLAIREGGLTLHFTGIWEQLLDRFNKPTAAAIVGLLRQKTFTLKLAFDENHEAALNIVEIDGREITLRNLDNVYLDGKFIGQATELPTVCCPTAERPRYQKLTWRDGQADNTHGLKHSNGFCCRYHINELYEKLWTIGASAPELIGHLSARELTFPTSSAAAAYCEDLNRAAWEDRNPPPKLQGKRAAE